MQKTVSLPFMLLGILFNVCLVASNLLETKVIQLGPITATAGLIVFPISYIINDCIAEVWGFKKARLIIWSGFAMNFLTIGFARLAITLPAAPFWEGEESFNFIFGLAPRIAIASLLAFLLGSFLNAYIMSKMKVATQGKYFSLRAILSTIAGESADSLLFFPLAFGGLIPVQALLDYDSHTSSLESLYEVIILPVTTGSKILKKIDQTDVYDKDISYNIIKIRTFKTGPCTAILFSKNASPSQPAYRFRPV